MKLTHLLGSAAITAALLTGATAPATAQKSCFEDVQCPWNHYIPKAQLWQLSCDSLWTVRNSIYHDNGYCFKTKRAKQVWGNQGCSYWDAADVPLNNYEQANVASIRSVEKQKGCN
jgi:hypothetical protein